MERNKLIAMAAVTVMIVSGVAAVVYYNNSEQYDIVIACGNKNCYEPFWIADGYGLFQKHDVKVDMKIVDGGGSATTALMSGRADLTLVGADPAIRLFDKTSDGMVIATIETAMNTSAAITFAALKSYDIDLNNPADTLLNTNGTVRIHCGMDTTTGYYSTYITYLYEAYTHGKLTYDQYQLLRTTKGDDNDGGIIHVEFKNQVSALLNDNIQMLCSGNTTTVASENVNVVSLTSPYPASVGYCVIIATGSAIAEKHDAIVKVLKALDEACDMIRDEKTVDMVAKFCAETYGANGWSAESQKNFFDSYYWDVCQMLGLADNLDLKAKLLGYDKIECSKRIVYDFLKEVHGDGVDFIYDPVQHKIVSNSTAGL
jgi:ABC-type nitrate/sulfonate/bicarbonate transport system substrate-binding protein